MTNATILIIEDDPDILVLIDYNLQLEGYNILKARTGREGIELALSEKPDLILLDILLPDFSGLQICKKLKISDQAHDIPVIMLTALSENRDIIAGLEAGASDYITKPFSPKVLAARVKAQLRDKAKSEKEKQYIIQYDKLTIDLRKYSVMVDGQKTEPLTPNEFKILTLLVNNPGWVFNRNDIINSVQGKDAVVIDRTIDVQIFSLRKKLGDYGNSIETIRGVGYRFKE